MDITSTPFIRNDYWPDYNELNELNGHINEVENELSLTNINLTDKIENVEGNLNAYISQQNNTVVTNNVIVNNINANYATGDFLSFNNVNLDNVYVENLTVNKPVFDITLNTPHIDNITVTGGNIFNTNIIDCEINTDNITVNNLNVAQGTAETFKVTGGLIINKSIAPVSSSAVLGYDATGKVIPVRATYDVSFPEDANYLYTDHFGTAYAGTAETEVTASDNLITAHAVYNEALNIGGNIDNLRNDMNNEFNIVNDNFANIDNNFANINNNFNDVANNFNDVNNFVNDGFNNVANNFNDVANELNDAYNTINKLQDKIRILSVDDASYYWSGAPVNYQNVTRIIFNQRTLDEHDVGTQISGKRWPVNIAFNSTSNILEFHSDNFAVDMDESFDFIYQPKSLLQIFNKDISYLFENCKQLNFLENPDSGEFNFNFCEPTGNFITNMRVTFGNCSILNQNILIPDSVTDMGGTFTNCIALNQNILIPNNVIDISYTFFGCSNLNQNILIPNSVNAIDGIFENCTSLNQPDMYIYSQNVTSMKQAFKGCHINNIHIPTSVPKDTSNFMYNCLVNGDTDITFPAANIFNDLPVDIEQWPPEA